MNGTEHHSQWTAWLAVLIAFAFFALLAPTSAQAGEEMDGKTLYSKNECTKCHSIITEGIEMIPDEEAEEEEEEDPFAEEGDEEDPPDLSGIGASWEHGEDGMMKWLIKKLEIDEELHKKKFPGTKPELKALSAWLMTLKEPAPAE